MEDVWTQPARIQIRAIMGWLEFQIQGLQNDTVPQSPEKLGHNGAQLMLHGLVVAFCLAIILRAEWSSVC